ncbi:MAG TPA: RhuM family protein [Cerasibacillus sp.]|uniref:RhuM family protein n=1 Tax=Cerasibacillus sp. TaxID=2498711 RepID=UPI002F405A5F
MKDWVAKLDAFLEFNEHDILENAGKVSKAVADQLALEQYENFHRQRLAQDTKSDFDKFIETKRLK